MKQKAYSVLVIILFSACMILFSTLYRSSLLFEDARIAINDDASDFEVVLSSVKPKKSDSFFYDTFIKNPANLELYLRASIVNSDANSIDKEKFYKRLLRTKPTWPYYYSGLAQVNNKADQYDSDIIKKIIKYGIHERKVVYSLAEVLFHNWNGINKQDKELILNYILEQREIEVTRAINISAKFAKIYEFCDFIYEKKQVEYAACKKNYWQPLSE